MSEFLPGIIPASSKVVKWAKGSERDLSHWHVLLCGDGDRAPQSTVQCGVGIEKITRHNT